MELSTRVNPKDYEDDIYAFWLKNNLFHADENSLALPYSIVIPPPNITGSLHLGHALNVTLQDILIRFHKLKGYETLWIPGTDHAGIATQNVVDRKLAKEGISRAELGREKFVEEVWKWRGVSGSSILNQLKRLGVSCDWERERFTMDGDLSAAVKKVFVSLYREGLIYRSNYMVNWCVRCHTALSDLEVDFEDEAGFMYNMRYPLKEGGFVEIATTRPETYLADSAVAVNPADTRYKRLIGKTVILPIINREIPVIADEYVDMALGTGCLKVTPSADPNDFVIGKRHALPEFQCMDESGVIVVSPFDGLDRFAARKKVVDEFARLELMGEVSPITHSVGHCYRCAGVIEPRISLQWFVKVKSLAEKAVEAVENGKTRILPKVWESNYFEWMRNIRDWCISRQLWWGHRIPAWHCKCGHITVSEDDTPSVCEKCGGTEITQETDVLDTWFSSALWPFSTQGWPKETGLLKKFYPTSVLVTAFDILFFWVARMMMFGLKFMGEVPFRDVYIHALIRDEKGEKMSKTKGNSIDPLEMADAYGADVLRFSLAIFAAQGRDIRISKARIEIYRNFLNKIWNASRFIFINLDSELPDIKKIEIAELRDEDRWILTKLKSAVNTVEGSILNYCFNDAAAALYNFFWNSFCDWYIELIKVRIFKDDGKAAALAAAVYVLRKALAAMHPFMPFVSEHIWKNLTGGKTILEEGWTVGDFDFPGETAKIDRIIEFIGIVRNIRGEYNISPAKVLAVYATPKEAEIAHIIKEKEVLINSVTRLSAINFVDTFPDEAAAGAAADYTVHVPLAGLADIAGERARLTKECERLEKDLQAVSARLKNEGFLAKASHTIIEKDTLKKAELEKQILNIKTALEALASK
ncbi:MAG: valine--tRNA ligase [Deferribacteraceae bacterium]|jgi:valyl-tRNA synthetase|nr:valine--tRNA ligase [Deferribacteraceae bacterium]